MYVSRPRSDGVGESFLKSKARSTRLSKIKEPYCAAGYAFTGKPRWFAYPTQTQPRLRRGFFQPHASTAPGRRTRTGPFRRPLMLMRVNVATPPGPPQSHKILCRNRKTLSQIIFLRIPQMFAGHSVHLISEPAEHFKHIAVFGLPAFNRNH